MISLRASVPKQSHFGWLQKQACFVSVLSFRRSIHMPPVQTKHHSAIKDIRNIGIIAHVDAGKTTTTERMLYYSGVTRRVGDVDSGNTVTDFLQLERERGITIQSAAITFNWPLPEDCEPGAHPKTINLIDTPGHQDFRFEVDRCLPVLDGAVCIIDSVKGVEAHTERVWASAQDHKIPRIVFVNKLDREGASFRKSVLEIGSRLNGWPLVCQIPWWEGDQFVGVIDVIDRVGLRWKTEKEKIKYEFVELQGVLSGHGTLLEEIETARERLVEGLADWDEAIMDLFADDPSKITSTMLKESIRRAIRSGEGNVIPVLAGASFRHIGVEPLMDAIVDYLPSPDERPELNVSAGAGKQSLNTLLSSHSDKKSSHSRVTAVASVFKVFNHPKEGVLSFVRVYSGELHRNSPTWNTNSQLFERPLGLVQISAAKTDDVQHLTTGQIGAVKGLKKARTGDTLLTSAGHKQVPDSLKHVQIRPPEIPPAVAFLAINPHGNTAAKELEIALDNASREDPSLRWSRDEKTEQFTLQGMGKLHLDIAIYNLKQNPKVQADFGPIEVDYKECLTSPIGPHHATFDRVVASKSGKVSCTATLEPLEEHHRQAVLEPSVERDGNIIHVIINLPEEDGIGPGFNPEEARQQLINGVVAAVARGPRRGSPVQGCHITITVDATEAENPSGGHFTGAASRAVREALRDAYTTRKAVGILEPVMLVNINCPEAAAGMVQHDISSGAGGQVLEVKDKSAESSDGSRRVDVSRIYAPPDPYESIASLKGKKSTARTVEIVARVPFKEVLNFDEHLRGKTGGRHSMTMAFDSFARVVGSREKDL